MSTSQPVVLCGKMPEMAVAVIEGLRPEFEVIHFITSVESGSAQIPLLLAGKEAPSDSHFGTKNYSHPPVAVITGAGYTDDDVAEMMKASGSVDKKVPWLRPDKSKRPPGPPGPDFAKSLPPRIKATLAKLEDEGKMGDAEMVLY